ncbi:hypothetical protein SteCoe_11159 [Stentor coeruleus]|uniref:RRM domain-containing protein n=1 Tax=Stentor coeruleus TaxID=5963 RepID=A0A1R2CDW8_9CILI|nr:hypothetical protein SteCoe_11159 [Stentor coeruleus]
MEDKQPLNDLDFTDVISTDPELSQYIDKELQLFKESSEPLVEPRPIFEMQWTNRVIVGGLPEVNEEKAQNLIKFLSRLSIKSNCPIEPSDIHMPMSKNMSLRFAIITFKDEETAKSAVTNLNGVNLDKKHSLTVVSFDEFDRIMELSDTYQEPRIYSQQQLKSWLTDSLGRDQFIIRTGEKTQVFWNDSLSRTPELVSNGPSGKVWTDKYVAWSSDGTYLATMHSRGVVIWAGPEFEEMGKLEHYGVGQVGFSPCERYVLTFSPKGKFIVWNFNTKEEMRVFPAEEEKWGTYKWSYNGDFLAKMAEESIFIYQTSSMSMLEDENGLKRPLKIDGLTDFSWSPGANIIACYIRENSNRPAIIKIISIPNKELIASRNLFDALACTFFWQSEGEYLLSLIRSKNQDTHLTQKTIFEVTCLKIKNTPTTSLSLNALVVSCAWQNGTNRFAVVAAYGKESHKKFAVYEIDSKKNIILIGEKDTQITEILWAPQGNQVVLYTKEKHKIVFYSIGEKGISDVEERTYSNLNYLEWDPSGRYLIVARAVELKSNQSLMGTGYIIYNGQGETVCQFPMEKFYQILWRPRPKFILPKEAHTKLINEYEHLTKKYAEQDREIKRKSKQEKLRKENEKKSEFLALLQKNREVWVKTAEERKVLYGRSDEEERNRWSMEQNNVEEVINVTKEKIREQVVS